MKKMFTRRKLYFLFIFFLVCFFIIVASGNHHTSVITYNVNRVKSVEAMHIVSKYNNLLENEIAPVFYDNFALLVQNGSDHPVGFVGTLTGYGPDCVGCGGKTGCPPRQDVTNGNIYFYDQNYGKVRIVATDSQIPCGSIVRISNYKFSSTPIIAIALDRGGAIKGKTMDLLYESEAATQKIGRQYNIQFEIIRWGW